MQRLIPDIFAHEYITTVPLELQILDSLGELVDVEVSFIMGENYHPHLPPRMRYKDSLWKLEHKHLHVEVPYYVDYTQLRDVYRSFIRMKDENN